MATVKLFVLRSCKNTNLSNIIRQFSTTPTVLDKRFPEDKITHTGQQWDKDDYRMVRYINQEKHVNPNIAIDLINAVPPKARNQRVVWCDGDVGGPTGHPRVYINLDKPGNHACTYCGLRFYKEDAH